MDKENQKHNSTRSIHGLFDFSDSLYILLFLQPLILFSSYFQDLWLDLAAFIRGLITLLFTPVGFFSNIWNQATIGIQSHYWNNSRYYVGEIIVLAWIKVAVMDLCTIIGSETLQCLPWLECFKRTQFIVAFLYVFLING